MEKPYCQYGEKCYRQNEDHFRDYRHDHHDKTPKGTTTENIGTPDIPADPMAMKDVIIEHTKLTQNLNAETLQLQNRTAATPQQMSKSADATNVIDIKPNIRAIQNEMAGSTSTVVAGCSLVVKTEKSHATITVKQEPTEQFRPMNIKLRQPKVEESPPNLGRIAAKVAAANPYNYFLTAIESSPQTRTETLTITFPEILDQSLGDLESSVQINCFVQPDWLLEQYALADQLQKPLLILSSRFTKPISAVAYPQIKTHTIQLNFGTHHAKMMLLAYTDGSMRVVVSTANLYKDEWRNHTQGLWISDSLPPSSTSPDSRTEFRKDLITYLSAYGINDLQPWISRIRSTDFSGVNVFLVTTVPGMHHGESHGLSRVRSLLSQHSAPIPAEVDIVAQCSTMGHLQNWLQKDFIASFQCHSRQSWRDKAPHFKLIYPSLANVLHSYDEILGGGCLLYSAESHNKQKWLTNHLYQWRAEQRYRTRAMPHTKTYARFVGNKLFWYILTSANLSKSAWGWFPKKTKTIRMNNYEAGVVFFPRFVTNTEYFSMHSSDGSSPVFPMLYDLPLTKYDAEDEPYTIV